MYFLSLKTVKTLFLSPKDLNYCVTVRLLTLPLSVNRINLSPHDFLIRLHSVQLLSWVIYLFRTISRYIILGSYFQGEKVLMGF
ncbi:hypothetical protein AMTRI_Chr13g91830 [Amborella trichopoda]